MFPDESAPPSRPSIDPIARDHVSRCFRTSADGRIPLRTDWVGLLAAARRFQWLALQTRHPFARLVSSGRLPAFSMSGREDFLADGRKPATNF